MIKTGIHSLKQLTGRTRLKTFLGKDKIVSLSLYDQILGLPEAELLAERILLLSADERGARKRTYAARLEEFDLAVLRLMHELLPPAAPLVLDDVAVSDARTACDFFDRVVTEFPNLAYTASDYDPQVLVLEDGHLKVTLSRNNKILEIAYPPFVFNSVKPEHPLFYPVNRAVRALVTRIRVRPLVKSFLAGKVRARAVLLFSARAVNLSKQDGRFRLAQHDVLSPLPAVAGRHVVRAMNVLNPSYFDEKQMSVIVSHVYYGLPEGGLLITGSNQEAGSPVNGGVYQRTVTGFRQIWKSGDGSPVESQILHWKAPASGSP